VGKVPSGARRRWWRLSVSSTRVGPRCQPGKAQQGRSILRPRQPAKQRTCQGINIKNCEDPMPGYQTLTRTGMDELMKHLSEIGQFMAGLGGLAIFVQVGVAIYNRFMETRKFRITSRGLVVALVVLIVGAGLIFASGGHKGGVQIVISTYPSVAGNPGPNDTADISGKVVGLSGPENYRIVLYAYSDHWYVQPSTEQKLTYLGPSGQWSTQTHFGSKYAIAVVKPPFDPPKDDLPSAGPRVVAIELFSAKH
jgi:hypothetical protein